MDERRDDSKEPEDGATENEIVAHISTADKALEKRDYTAARKEVIQAQKTTIKIQDEVVAKAISSSEFKVNYARNIGADVAPAEKLLREAKAAHKAGDARLAVELAMRCIREAERAKERYKGLVDLIYEVETLISESHKAGKSTTDSERHLSNAVNLKSRNGTEAIAEALEARRIVIQSLGRSVPQVKKLPEPGFVMAPPMDTEDRELLETRIQDLKNAIVALQLAQSQDAGPIKSARLLMDVAQLVNGRNRKDLVDVGTAMALLEKCQAALEEEAELASPVVKTELKLKGFLVRSLRYGDWNDALLVLLNTGKTAALEVEVKLSGDVELESLPPIARLAPGEKKELKIRLRPRQMGEQTAELRISFKRTYDNKTLEVKHEVKLAVK